MIAAGKLTDFLCVKAKGMTLDSFGEANVEVLSPIASVRCEVMALSTSERTSGATRPNDVIKFRIRHIAEMTTNHVIEFEHARYDIEGIENGGQNRREFQIITARRNEQIS
jgi:head-tail adaptor